MIAEPPGSRAPALVQAGQFLHRPYEASLRRWRQYGDCYTIKFPLVGKLHYVAHPDLVKQVFGGDPNTMHAGEANSIPLGPVLGTYSLLTLDDDAHMSQRKLLLPPFHGDAVRRYEELIDEIANRSIDTWPVGSEFALRPKMQDITLEVILRAVFGVQDRERLVALGEAVELVAKRSTLAVWRLAPKHRLNRAIAKADVLIYEEIARRRADPGGDDVLSLLLDARHEDGSPMSDQELRDELMTLLGAGHETTATALSWAFERLTRTPDALERLLSEPDDDAYLEAVVKEALRARPVVVDVGRKLTRDFEIGDWHLPAGSYVLPSITVLSMRPDLWPEPDQFRPERFSDEGAVAPYSWIPFGGGVRRCIGAAFAQVEMKVVLRAIARRVRLHAANPAPEPPRVRHVTIVPGQGGRVIADQVAARGKRPLPPPGHPQHAPARAAARPT